MTNPAQIQRPTVISTDEDPEAAARLAASILSDDDKDDKDTGTVAVPFITPPPVGVYTLPGGGLIDADGTCHDEVEVRELTGADEERLSKAEANKNMGRYMQTIVKCGLVRIGEHERPSQRLLDELLIGDRSMILHAIRRATYGDEMALTMICPKCGAAIDANYDLANEIPIKKLDDLSQRRLEVKLRHDRVAVVRIPTAGDQDALFALQGKTLAEANTVLLSRCLISIDGMPANSMEAALALGAKDRGTLLDEMTEAQPGPKYGEVMIECPGCNSESPSVISLLDLFRG